MTSFNPEFMYYTMIICFGIYIVLQIYVVYKLKIIISKLFEILIHFENVLRVFKLSAKPKTIKLKKSCQICKYRLAFYDNEKESQGYLFYRCQISRKDVKPDFVCNDFVFDPQTYNV